MKIELSSTHFLIFNEFVIHIKQLYDSYKWYVVLKTYAFIHKCIDKMLNKRTYEMITKKVAQ